MNPSMFLLLSLLVELAVVVGAVVLVFWALIEFIRWLRRN